MYKSTALVTLMYLTFGANKYRIRLEVKTGMYEAYLRGKRWICQKTGSVGTQNLGELIKDIFDEEGYFI